MYKLLVLSALVAVAFAASYEKHESHEHAYSTQNQVNWVKDSVPVEIKVHSAPEVHHAPVEIKLHSAPEVHHVPVVSHVPVVHHVPVLHHGSYHH